MDNDLSIRDVDKLLHRIAVRLGCVGGAGEKFHEVFTDDWIEVGHAFPVMNSSEMGIGFLIMFDFVQYIERGHDIQELIDDLLGGLTIVAMIP